MLQQGACEVVQRAQKRNGSSSSFTNMRLSVHRFDVAFYRVQRIDPPHDLVIRGVCLLLILWQCLYRFEEATPRMGKTTYMRQFESGGHSS